MGSWAALWKHQEYIWDLRGQLPSLAGPAFISLLLTTPSLEATLEGLSMSVIQGQVCPELSQLYSLLAIRILKWEHKGQKW